MTIDQPIFYTRRLGTAGFWQVLFLSMIWISCTSVPGRTGWQKIITTQDLWGTYPEPLHYLLGALDPNYPGLVPVRNLLAKGDTVAAVQELLQYWIVLEQIETDRPRTIQAL